MLLESNADAARHGTIPDITSIGWKCGYSKLPLTVVLHELLFGHCVTRPSSPRVSLAISYHFRTCSPFFPSLPELVGALADRSCRKVILVAHRVNLVSTGDRLSRSSANPAATLQNRPKCFKGRRSRVRRFWFV